MRKGGAPHKREDFDAELVGRAVSIKLADGEWINGVLEAGSRYWWKIRVNGRPVYVNKSKVSIVEVGHDG